MKNKLWKFIDGVGSFEAKKAHTVKSLYFPLANEVLMSSISPDLHGDIKTGQDSFLLAPVSRIDLVDSRSSRNFWIYTDKGAAWSATGVSRDSRQIGNDRFNLKAGLLWHEVTRENKKVGLRAEILSFVPAAGEPIEVMLVKLTNIISRKIRFVPTAAIPMYARGAGNIRDHRHVTSLLQKIKVHKFGIITEPTLVFDESAHRQNKDIYFVLGWDEDLKPPQYFYPTEENFYGDGGDLEAPESLLKNILPKYGIRGEEPMGGLRFHKVILGPGEERHYLILMGIVRDEGKIMKILNRFNSLDKVKDAFERTKDFWIANSQRINLSTGNFNFDNWFRWVSIQPILRRIYGCSFLPDFDYGKGGRGWRDLWQDSLSLVLNNPDEARGLLINNFSGVKIDGSNAAIVGRKKGEFICDRNGISRVWMDHGVWPALTLDLYLNETGDFDILFDEASYFRNHEINRSRALDRDWDTTSGRTLKTSAGKIYKGTVLEHLLVQNLVQFFNVGSHNNIRLENADWNDGLDMAKEKGESIAFTAMYAHTIARIAQILLKAGRRRIEIAEELKILLKRVDYDDVKAKVDILNEYFAKTRYAVSGNKVGIDSASLAENLKIKADWMSGHIRGTEWLKAGWFNGYYNNNGERVEGAKGGAVRMFLTSQVFPIMSGVAEDWQVVDILNSVKEHLFDKKQKGFHLNTDFKGEQRDLGRAFSFTYGNKENGAFFNHITVMYAYALYKRGFVKEGWQVLSSVYNMSIDTAKSKIYPCLPEYFNLDGRGMYAYLTGSASWFVLTIVAQVFGLRGEDGDLVIEPKLCAEQFKDASTLTISRPFAGRSLRINYSNPKKLDWDRYKISKATLNSEDLPLGKTGRLIIKKGALHGLSADKINILDIFLG